MRDSELDELLTTARRAARAGARVALDWRAHADRLLVEEKAGPADLVSQADRETETAIRAVLAAHRPGDGVLGEEHGALDGRSGVRWLVDPIDGTTSYLYGRSDWAVSVAACDAAGGRLLAGVVVEPELDRMTEARRGGGTRTRGAPVAVLEQDDLARTLVEVNLGRPEQRPRAAAMVGALASRVRDLRRGGSAAAALANVATARADAAWLPGLQPWDCAAGVLLVLEAGGVVGDLDGRHEGTWPRSGDVLAASKGLFEPLRGLLSPAYGNHPLRPDAVTDWVK
ncbi:inositol monophosphatase [Paractinoplanes abujensis]|uniref:inositol-phosphate phosphatase n=1 Tax=Paractinoplanes abujensis TaxID=882441 RepID=A0A7W7G6T3_9ACTN|nr:inositol monophosphatase [Actinoplanes abujensis]MBB4698392.1 myo-inositol-1(or 4)-monophosphatase [Actinoplanes abujensis]GID19122.1 inositol monophosphatase [Actinoplanes abujensis]